MKKAKTISSAQPINATPPKPAKIELVWQSDRRIGINVRYDGIAKLHVYEFDYVKHFDEIRHLLELQPDCNECENSIGGNCVCKDDCHFVALKKEVAA